MLAPQQITAVHAEGDSVLATADRGHFRFTAWGENIVHVAWFPTPRPTPLPMWGIEPRRPEAPGLDVEVRSGAWRLTTAQVQVDLAADATCGFHREGEELARLQGVGLTPIHLSGEATYHVHATFGAYRGEAYYGLGQHQRDWMDHTHWDVKLWHDYKAEGGEIIGIPFLVTNRDYAVVWDNPARSWIFPGGGGRTLWWSEVGEAVSFFLIAGAGADALYSGYRTLTGETPLPPRAALGYIQCKQRYKSQEEACRSGTCGCGSGQAPTRPSRSTATTASATPMSAASTPAPSFTGTRRRNACT